MNQNPKIPNVLMSTATPFADYAGVFYYREGKHDQALKAFDVANSINPYLNRSDFYKAIIAEERGLQDSAYLYMKSSFYKRTIKINVDVFSKALSLAVPYQDTVEILSMYHHYDMIHHDSEAAHRTAHALLQSHYSYDGLVEFVSGEKEKFQEDTLAQQNLKSVLVMYHINEGQNYYSASQPDLALKSFQQALEIDTDNVLALQRLGMHYYNVGKIKEAIPYLMNSIEKQGLPNPGQSEFILGLSYLRLQNISQACHFLGIAKTNFPAAANLHKQLCR